MIGVLVRIAVSIAIGVALYIGGVMTGSAQRDRETCAHVYSQLTLIEFREAGRLEALQEIYRVLPACTGERR